LQARKTIGVIWVVYNDQSYTFNNRHIRQSNTNILRDFKRHTLETLHTGIIKNNTESRREWLLWMMERAGKKNGNNSNFQLWQQHNQTIELTDNKMAHQKLDYMHYNPVEAGFVLRQEDWLYSSAIDYNGGKGLLEIMYLDTLML